MNTVNDDRREDLLRSNENNSPDSLEREVDEARARVGRTANELSDRLSPGELLDQALGMAREHAGEFSRNLGAQVKSNPLPMILTSVGISWMMMSSRNNGQTIAYDDYESYTDEDDGPSLRDGFRDVKDSLGTVAHRSLDKAHEIGDRIHGATANVKHTARNARESVVDFYRDQPLIAGSLGIAIGAALGALVPATEIEDDMFGEARDRSVEAVKLQAARKYDEVRESARDSFS